MLNNSFVFSLILSIINTLFLYLFTNNSSEIYENRNGNKTNVLILLFGITFATSFVLKSLSNQNTSIPKVSFGVDILSYSSRTPF